jgi:organic radical activating enzyme
MHELVSKNALQELRKNKSPVIIVAAVREAEAIKYACESNGIEVAAFCDSEKRKTLNPFCGKKVIHTPDLKDHYPVASFVIASQHIQDVAEQLTEMGYENFYSALEILENFDHNNFNYLISKEYMSSRLSSYKKTHQAYFKSDIIYMRSLDVMITTKCSLKCESCSNLMQYYKSAENFTFEKIIAGIDTLTSNVDEISEFRIIGGEPLMNKDWARIIDGILIRKPSRKIFIYTNGTIPPKEQDMDLLKKYGCNINFIITDYGSLSKNINILESSIKKNKFAFIRTPPENWIDCSTIRHHKRDVAALKEVFKQCCVKYVYTLLNGKLYRCPFIANAANLKAIPDNPSNYVDLENKESNIKNKIKKLVNVRTFFPACDFCDGRPYDPTSSKGYDGKGMISTPGKQVKENISYKVY